MSGRRRGGSGRGLKQVSVVALLALGCCLLSAPTANADFDDLLDNVIGAAAAGADVDPGGTPIDSADLEDLGVLNDPLSQLDQVLHETPGSTPDAAPDTSPDAEHDAGSGSSNSMPSIPKFSMPSGGNGSGGSGGGSGGSGGSGASGARPKANTSAAKDFAVPQPAAPQPEVP